MKTLQKPDILVQFWPRFFFALRCAPGPGELDYRHIFKKRPALSDYHMSYLDPVNDLAFCPSKTSSHIFNYSFKNRL